MIRIGVLGPSDIAYRRTVPAIVSYSEVELAGIAVSSKEEWECGENIKPYSEQQRSNRFRDVYGCKIYDSYSALLEDSSVDAVYIPLPPALHFYWSKRALEYGKHVFVEKPCAINYKETNQLIQLAEKKNLALHENFAFVFHKQVQLVQDLIKCGEIGELRLIRTCFGFPYRGENDFRYYKKMGGGALLDCGGYPIKLASVLLGGKCSITSANITNTNRHDVDIYGSATLENEKGEIAQVAFGMDNAYKCDVEVWGSKGTISTSRIFTPPSEMNTEIIVKNCEEKCIIVEADDQFKNSLIYFCDCIKDQTIRRKNYDAIREQSRLLMDVMDKGNRKETT